MKLAILGATGPSGLCLVQQALDAGHDVIALVRNPAKLQIVDDHLKVEKVDIFSEESLRPHFVGCDAVMSGLGVHRTVFCRAPVTFYLDTIEVIVKAMRAASVTRLICMSAYCTTPDPNNPFLWKWVFRPFVIGKVLDSMAEMEEYLLALNDIDFTVVRPPILTNDGISGEQVHVEEAHFNTGRSKLMSRADVAAFMLSIIRTDQWNRKAIAIAH